MAEYLLALGSHVLLATHFRWALLGSLVLHDHMANVTHQHCLNAMHMLCLGPWLSTCWHWAHMSHVTCHGAAGNTL
jgi:hypothetical protein